LKPFTYRFWNQRISWYKCRMCLCAEGFIIN
jgi:hypothetical protein